MTLKVAFDRSMSFMKRWNCAFPSMVRLGSLILSLHACETGCENDGMKNAKVVRVDCGRVGARSGLCVCGLSQVCLKDALALLNERSSSRKSCRFFPHRSVLYSPPVLV